MHLLFLIALCLGLVAAESHWPPVLDGTEVVKEGLKVYYSVDLDTYTDADAPDKTYILLNQVKIPYSSQADGSALISKDDLQKFDNCDSSFRPVHVYPNRPAQFPPKKNNPDYAQAPSNLHVSSSEKHRINVQWTNNYAPNTNHYGKLLFRLQRRGQPAQQWDIDNGYTQSYSVGPFEPNVQYLISVKAGYSYGTGYGYSKWTTIVWTSPDNGPPIIGWRPRYSIGPGNAKTGSAVTALWARKYHLDLFIVNSDGHVVTNWWESDKGWNGWYSIGCDNKNYFCPKFAPGTKVTALWRSNYAHIDVFVTSPDGIVWATWWNVGDAAWRYWATVQLETAAAASAPVEAIWNKEENHLDLFVSDINGDVMWTYVDKGSDWASWAGISTMTGMVPGTPITASWLWDYSKLHIYATDKRGYRPHAVRKATDKDIWYAAYGLGPNMAMRPGSKLSVTWFGSNVLVAGLGTDVDGNIWQTTR
ncbi:hypothetical protein VHEMI07686 [[Torrubiella] hemipterigena]|uniref:Fibronectin type-III domain-containing protein n=1 Tax=[Torrubiella] hemipterigena TaxID=1531966 RepID=A0A0A1TLT3_9HYPO|nr:hypothetical protein VHEMI07686 [[Torrubiella] hemipterigena]